MLKVCGKVVFVKSEKNEKTGRHFKRIQLLSNGGGTGRAVLHDVTDMGNQQWVFGSEVEVICAIDVYQGKRGISYSLTHWGSSGDLPEAGVVVNPPLDSNPPPPGTGKSASKFGG